MSITGIILAAGRGSRLRHLTDERPKCMVELGGRPLLHWQVAAMRGAGVTDLVVVRGYKSECLTGDFAVCDNPRWSQTHMVASLLCARDRLAAGPCLVSYSDIVYPAAALRRLAAAEAPLAILYDVNWRALWQRRSADPLADTETFRIDRHGSVTEIGRKPVSLDEVQGQYMGLLRFTPESLQWVEALRASGADLDRTDMTSLLGGLLSAGHRLLGVPWDGAWCEVDNAEDLAVAEEIVAGGGLKLDPA